MKKALCTITAAAALAFILNSCSTASHSTSASYQNHLKSKHTGAHHLNTTNRGCNWNR